MEQTFNKNKYAGFIKVVQVIVKVVMIFLYVILGFVALGFVASLIIPNQFLEFDLSVFSQYDFQGINIINAIDPTLLERTVNLKRVMIVMFFVASLNLGFAQFILIHINKLLKNVKEEPFNAQNSIILRNLGIGYVIGGVVISLFNEFLRVIVVRTIDIFDTNFDIRLNWQYIFIGVLILILGYIFSYGSYLQEEHDQTV
ncbi:MAG: DUF2975 domain-containing protein [Acholeplasmataceae bacterium]